MIRKFCDRTGQLISDSDAFTMTWFDGKAIVTSDLCKSCHDALIAWFGKGNPEPEAVKVEALKLQSAAVLLQSEPAIVDTESP